MKPHLTYYISLKHATAMIKKMNTKKQRDSGYSFSLTEADEGRKFQVFGSANNYSDYKPDVVLYKLEIFYKKPE